MDNKKEVLSTGNEGVKNLMETITSKISVDQSKEILSNLKDSIVENIHERRERATSFINSLKKDKIRNLERLLDVTKREELYLYYRGRKNGYVGRPVYGYHKGRKQGISQDG